MMPAKATPMIGASQNNHNCRMDHPPTKSAGLVPRAGFTEVFVTGILVTQVIGSQIGYALIESDAM